MAKAAYLSLRLSTHQHEDIKARARAREMSTSAYVIAASLGQLEVEPETVTSRFDSIEDVQRDHERRLSRIEALAGDQL